MIHRAEGTAMLVQYRRGGRLRMFRQHDHAILSGELAAAWTGVSREPHYLPFDLVLATALHDVAWREPDRLPRHDRASGGAVPFHDWPLAEKLDAYRSGLDEVYDLHPYGALLGSLHYTSFLESEGTEEFRDSERTRRAAIEERLGLDEEARARLDHDLDFLRLFDNLSIFVCLSPPSASLEFQPDWVEECRHLRTPHGDLVHLTWIDDDVLHADPFPFVDALELRIPYRELGGLPFDDEPALLEAWDAAPERHWWVSLRSALRLA